MRKPISPRAGTRYSIRTQPLPWLIICSIRPLRSASSCVTTPDVLLGHVDAHPLDRLVAAAVDLPGDDLGLADGQLEALAAHQLDQDRQRQLAAALDLPHLGRSVAWTRSETLPISSRSRRALTWLAVSLSPSCRTAASR